MPEPATPATPQAGGTGDTSPQAGGTPPSTVPATGGKTPDDYERMIAELRKEAAASRVKANELDKLKADLEASKLSETEKLQKRIADLQKERDTAISDATALKITNAVSSQAARLGFADPDDAVRFLDAARIADDLSNIETLLKELLKAKPYLAGKQQASSGGATNPGRNATSGAGQITAEFVRTMTNEQYNGLSAAQRDEVQTIMRTMHR